MVRKRVRVVYEGRVQGVGFRFNACQLSRGLNISGFVRNDPDGSVCLEAEGVEHVLEGFLESIRASRLEPNIRREHIEWCAPQGDTSTFSVTR